MALTTRIYATFPMYLAGAVMLVSGGVSPARTEYIAAVVEYAPFENWSPGGGADILMTNAARFADFARKAKIKNADIIVFPEYGLTGTTLSEDESDFESLAQIVPDPGEGRALCTDATSSYHVKALRFLSCAARDLQLYIVVNVAEIIRTSKSSEENCSLLQRLKEITRTELGMKDGEETTYFNTQVVFDRSGKVIARYRKKHLFLEPQFSPGRDAAATALFYTDFGVTFTLQVCFEIMFETPGLANIRDAVYDVAMSTAWIDELPFLTAPQAFSQWAQGLGINLLVANIHMPTHGKIGSGIFPAVSWSDNIYVYNTSSGSQLVVGKVVTTTAGDRTVYKQPLKSIFIHNSTCPNGSKCQYLKCPANKNKTGTAGTASSLLLARRLDRKSSATSSTKKQTTEHFIIHEDLSNYTYAVMSQTKYGTYSTMTLCHNKTLCCHATYTYPQHDTDSFSYMMLAYDGVILKGGGVYGMGIQICAVVYCLDEADVRSCANLNEPLNLDNGMHVQGLSGNFRTRYVYPSAFTLTFDLLRNSYWSFEKHHHSRHSISLLKNVNNLLALTLFARIYEDD